MKSATKWSAAIPLTCGDYILYCFSKPRQRPTLIDISPAMMYGDLSTS